MSPPTHQNLFVIQEFIDKHPELHTGIGKLKGYRAKLHIDESAVASKSLPTTFHIRGELNGHIKDIQDLGHYRGSDRPESIGIVHSVCYKAWKSKRKAFVRGHTKWNHP